MGDDVADVQMPEVGSEWINKATGWRVTVLPPDTDNPRGPQVVFRYENGVIDACSVDEFHEAFDPAPPMPTVADRWHVVTRGGGFVTGFPTEDAAERLARRNDLLVARMVCVEVREPRPAGEASDG